MICGYNATGDNMSNVLWLPERLRNPQREIVFEPFLHQIPLLHLWSKGSYDESDDIRTAFVCAHRRAGKSVSGALGMMIFCNHLLKEEVIFNLRGKVDSRDPCLGFFAETKEAARAIIWLELKFRFKSFPGVQFNNQRLSITIPRHKTEDQITIDLLSYRDAERVRGRGFRAIFADEIQLANEEVVKKTIIPALKDQKGMLIRSGTATPIGSFGKEFKDAIKRKLTNFLVPVTMTTVFTKEELEKIEIEVGEHTFRQEFLCDFDVGGSSVFFEERLKDLMNNVLFYKAQQTRNRCLVLAVDIGVGQGFSAWLAEIDPQGQFIDVLDFYNGYSLLSVLREDIEERYNAVPDCIILPWDKGRQTLEVHETRTTEDVFVEAFGESLIIGCDKAGQNEVFPRISQVNDHLHLLRFPPHRTSSDAHIGLHWLRRFRKKVNKDGVTTNLIDKTDPSSHAGDSLINLFIGLNVQNGRVNNIPSYRAYNRSHGVQIMPSNRYAAKQKLARAQRSVVYF